MATMPSIIGPHIDAAGTRVVVVTAHGTALLVASKAVETTRNLTAVSKPWDGVGKDRSGLTLF